MPTNPLIELHSLANIFKQELTQHEWASELDFTRLRCTDLLIYEVPDGKTKFSDALWNICFPCIQPCALWHYTSISAMRDILTQWEIRLHSIEKHMGEGELTVFAGQFNLDGYLNTRDDGTHMIDDLARDLFYLSLTADNDPRTRWDSFGPVRLRLRVEPVRQRAELRQIAYSSTESLDTHPLKVLQGVAQKQLNRSFVPSQISRAGAFCLPFYFDDEAEVRLLVKKFDADDSTQVRSGPVGSYVAVPLNGQHQRVRITILEVEFKDISALAEIAGLDQLLSKAGIKLRQYSR